MGSPVLQFRWPAVPTPGGAAIQLFVAAVVSVAPLSALLLVGIACNLSCLHGTPLLLQVYAATEVLFYGCYRIRLAQLSPCMLPPNPLERDARRAAISRTFALSRDMKRFLTGWFQFCRFEDIHYDNALEWIAWSMFGDFVDRVSPREQEELEGYIKEFENHVGQPFQPGYNEALRNRCIRINLDAVSARHRPLISYIVTYTAHAVGWVWLTLAGFTQAQAGELSYWYRPPRGLHAQSSTGSLASGPPVVLLHGIGLGLVPYLGMLQRLINQHGTTSTIICPEFPHIAQRFFASPPSSVVTATAIRIMLCRHCPLHSSMDSSGDGRRSHSPSPDRLERVSMSARPTPACFIGHSFGSVVVSWLIKNVPEVVGSVLLLDPVSLMLQEPDVAHNFLYRDPDQGSAVQAFFKYFVATELHVANTLHRHFWWHENVLWLEDLPPRLQDPCVFKVLLAGGDEIVNVPLVLAHLKEFRGAHDKELDQREGTTNMIADVVVKPDLDHAEVVVSSDGMDTALGMLAASMHALRRDDN